MNILVQYYQVVAGSGFYLSSSNFATPPSCIYERSTVIVISYSNYLFSTGLICLPMFPDFKLKSRSQSYLQGHHLTSDQEQAYFFLIFSYSLSVHGPYTISKGVSARRSKKIFFFNTGVLLLFGTAHYHSFISITLTLCHSITIFTLRHHFYLHVCYLDWAFFDSEGERRVYYSAFRISIIFVFGVCKGALLGFFFFFFLHGSLFSSFLSVTLSRFRVQFFMGGCLLFFVLLVVR